MNFTFQRLRFKECKPSYSTRWFQGREEEDDFINELPQVHFALFAWPNSKRSQDIVVAAQ